MDSLSEEVWDAVIAGTSIPQSLLALALSRSGKKILHVDRNDYYGGEDAGLSLQDAVKWTDNVNKSASHVYKEASISTHDQSADPSPKSRLASSRAYTLSLNPQILYAQSAFLPSLVSSRIHTQLEFLAVGSWWICRDKTLHKIPSTREDVFNDETLSMKDKRGLMKFLRFVLQEEEEDTQSVATDPSLSLEDALKRDFKIRDTLQAPILALALSTSSAASISFVDALRRIRRHMRSIGYFGPGFGAVVAKYGGNSEIAQVACRAGAVGGAIYLLGQELRNVNVPATDTPRISAEGTEDGILFHSTLPDNTLIRSTAIVGSVDDVPLDVLDSTLTAQTTNIWKSINVVADPLRDLFPPTSDNGPTPAVAIVLVNLPDIENSDHSPVYLQIHSEDTGECPAGQCIIYGSLASNAKDAEKILKLAVESFVETCSADNKILWTMTHRALTPTLDGSQNDSGVRQPVSNFFCFGTRAHDLSFPDDVLSSVKEVWTSIMGSDTDPEQFLRFEERETDGDE